MKHFTLAECQDCGAWYLDDHTGAAKCGHARHCRPRSALAALACINQSDRQPSRIQKLDSTADIREALDVRCSGMVASDRFTTHDVLNSAHVDSPQQDASETQPNVIPDENEPPSNVDAAFPVENSDSESAGPSGEESNHIDAEASDHDVDEAPPGIPPEAVYDNDSDARAEEDISKRLHKDIIVAYMFQGLTNTQKQRIILSLRMLAVINGTGPEDSVLSTTSIRTVPAYDAYMDNAVKRFHCGFQEMNVQIHSDVPALRALPPVKLYYRDVADVLTCAFAAASIPPAGFSLTPIQPDSSGVRASTEHGRVNTYMQGTHVCHAKRVRFNRRRVTWIRVTFTEHKIGQQCRPGRTPGLPMDLHCCKHSNQSSRSRCSLTRHV